MRLHWKVKGVREVNSADYRINMTVAGDRYHGFDEGLHLPGA
jgi:hypothetical protein